MTELLTEALLDSIKVFPFLFISFLIIELVEHKVSHIYHHTTKQSPFSVILSGLAGCIPICGNSVIVVNLWNNHIIATGSLIAALITTSDEAILLLLSEHQYQTSIYLVIIKVIIAIVIGIIYDRCFPSSIHSVYLKQEHSCKDPILLCAFKHTLKIIVFILLTNIVLNILLYYSYDSVVAILSDKNTWIHPFLFALIGLIPNCGAGILITELYLENLIPFSSLLTGLISSTGVGIAFLFKTHKNPQENLRILFILFFTAVITGFIL